ncbi:unnamed protein product [Musa acuminata var. zebrina]
MDASKNSSSAATSLLGDFTPGEGGEDGSLEWLSIYVEDCLSSAATSYTTFDPLPASAPPQTPNPKPAFKSLAVQAKARTKRRRRITPGNLSIGTCSTFHLTSSDPPLLHQAHWLAESELILPKKEEEDKTPTPALGSGGGGGGGEEKLGKEGVHPRRCTHCLSQKTPQWRAGPLGPKTLCNACGVRFKSGRLLPEYRPAKSPTFVSYKHSNSHKKVMMMRTALLSSNPN